jgi:hypothetical protein
MNFRERQKVKIYFLPGMSARNHWQSQRFLEGQATKTRLERVLFLDEHLLLKGTP